MFNKRELFKKSNLKNDLHEKNIIEDEFLNEGDIEYNDVMSHITKNQRSTVLKRLEDETLRARIEKEKVHAFKASAIGEQVSFQ